ncbi:hypothetical protein [Bauldia litoralis]
MGRFVALLGALFSQVFLVFSCKYSAGLYICEMQNHKFSVGQKVKYYNRVRTTAAQGEYEIVRLLPAEEGQFQYRIKSELERNERVAAEDQLNPPKAAI